MDTSGLKPQLFSRTHVERIICTVRVALASSSLFGVWLDPNEPSRFTQLTYTLYALYVAYSIGLALLMWRRESTGRAPIVTHAADILIASVFQYLTLGPSSPFFTYFVFSLFSAALRWGWQATLRTAAFVLVTFIVIGVALGRTLTPAEFELNRFVIRGVYLCVVAVVLVYLGQHEERLRDEIRQLARWPSPALDDEATFIPQLLEHATKTIGAARSAIVWSKDEEPWVYLLSWDGAPGRIDRLTPQTLDPPVAAGLSDVTFLTRMPFSGDTTTELSRGGVIATWRGHAVHDGLRERLGTQGLVSTPFVTERVSGRAFFAGFAVLTTDILPLVEVVGRQVGTSLDQLYAYERSRAFAIAEDRIRLSRDLHDGVLQSLTGLRLELQEIARPAAVDSAPAAVRDRLLGIERALALEQRELRQFIDGLKPSLHDDQVDSLQERLAEIQRRIGIEWRTPVALHMTPEDLSVGPHLERPVALMVHEAVINAVKHGKPSAVGVTLRSESGHLFITVEDDGTGFPFTGRRDQHQLLETRSGPISLRDRVMTLGGHIAIQSTPTGARIEISVPLEAVHA